MLGSDAREEWDGNTMPDTRVIHFWDGNREAGQWFAKQIDGWEGIAWDVYYLYGPEATWESAPQPLLASGETIYAERETLKQRVSILLER
jgi:hypothetical protein